MNQAIKWKGFAWLLLAACLLTLLLPWITLRENGHSAWEMMRGMIGEEQLEQEIREAIEEEADAAAEEGYELDPEAMSDAILLLLHGDFRIWDSARFSAAVCGGLSVTMQRIEPYFFDEEGNAKEVGPFGEEEREILALLRNTADRFRMEAVLWWILLGLALAGALCAAVSILREKRWGVYIFGVTALALFLLNLTAVLRNNSLIEKILSYLMGDFYGGFPGYGRFCHVAPAAVCFLIFAALLVLHGRFDLIDLLSRVTLRPKEEAGQTLPEEMPAPTEEPKPEIPRENKDENEAPAEEKEGEKT